ncbi:MAG: pyridoxal phosphate-dependent aminotransferase [Moorea sp. SIOASIH]|uniref:pyridoxal phosphate-dependent aminotransferase n=1 Tax=Moorena sp. SIOASIH TaxID=2607817 RepID=UPI0013BA366A|nr:pyridoxal phosphate-dependent aminotransferase [Moorena sp. SIOASIH]NEO39759.1 pyridoxal phosphate-dependent aminotransferase [Moorena sp. SIOASIH]
MPESDVSCPPLAMDIIMEVFDRPNHQGLEPINFGKGISSFNPFDHVDVNIDSVLLGHHVGYGNINGINSLRQAICRYYQEKFDYDLSPDRVCITNGASGALTLAFAMLLNKADEIILSEACYPAYNVLAKIFGVNCRLAPMGDDYCIDIEQLPNQISNKTKAIVINSPSNPYGTFLQDHQLEAIANLGVPVIFDEVYQALPLNDEPIPSAIRFSDRHLIISSLSKSLAIAGVRVGYLIVPESQVELMTNVKAVLNMCTSLPSQLIAEKLIQHWDELVSKHRYLLRYNWLLFERTAKRLGLKLRTHPQAGFFALVDVAEAEKDAMELSLHLAQNYALSSAPGIDFHDHDHAFLRLNFASPAHHIETGLTRLAGYLLGSEQSLQQPGRKSAAVNASHGAKNLGQKSYIESK